MRVVRLVPVFTYLLIAFNITAFINPGDSQAVLNNIVFQFQLISGAVLKFSVEHLLISFGVIALYIEIFKSTRASQASVINHMLSMVVFVLFLVEFIAVKTVGTASFLILTLMSMFDVIAGFTVSISSARRDIEVIRE